MCYKKKNDTEFKRTRPNDQIKRITEFPHLPIEVVKVITDPSPLMIKILADKRCYEFEADRGARDNFCSMDVLKNLGKPTLTTPKARYVSVTGASIPVKGIFTRKTSYGDALAENITFNVSTLPINLLGRSGIGMLKIDINHLLQVSVTDTLNKIESIAATKSQLKKTTTEVARVTHTYKVGVPCYALYCRNNANQDGSQP